MDINIVRHCLHELNNYITGILGYSQLLAKKEMPEDIKTMVEKINLAANKAADAAKKILAEIHNNNER